MRNIFLTGLLAAAASAAPARAAGQQPAGPEAVILVANPVSFSDGTVGGGSAQWRMPMNEPRVIFVYSGKTLCETSAPTAAVPQEAGQGWRLEITPTAQVADGIEARIRWKRLPLDILVGDRTLANWMSRLEALQAQGLKPLHPDVVLAHRTIEDIKDQLSLAWKPNETRVTLRPGSRVTLDYLGATPRYVSPNMAAEVNRVTGCNALGMGLEIGLEPRGARAIVETDLWLVYTRPDKPEQTQHQTLRVRAGDSAMYWFDDVEVMLVGAPIQVSGRISPVDLGDGKIHMKLTIARSAQSAHTGIASSNPAAVTLGPPTGSTTYDLTAEPGEVLSFQLPPIRSVAAGALAVRVRARTLGPSLASPAPAQQTEAGAMSVAHQALLTEALSFQGITTVMKVVAKASGAPSPPAPMQRVSPSYRPQGTRPPAVDMSNVVEPKMVGMVEAVYPPTAITDGIQGSSTVEAIIDHDGRVIEPRIVAGGESRLDQATLAAIKQWRYSPMKQGGVPKAILVSLTVTYALR